MLPYKDRLANLRRELHKIKAGAFITCQPVNVRYLTGFSGSSCWLVMSGERISLYVDSRYTEQAEKEAGRLCRVITWKGPEKALWLYFQKAIRTKTVAFEGDTLSFDRVRALQENLKDKKWINCGALVKKQRSVKDSEEIHNIKRAVDIAQMAFGKICHMIKPGVRESEVALELEYLLKKSGAEKAAFDIIVLAAKRSSLPHGKPTDKKIAHNTIILIDFGAVYMGYHSDLTRILALGKMPDKFRELFNIVLGAKELGINAIGPGRLAKEVDCAAREYIRAQGWGGHFGHGLGHGLGLDIHEYPVLSPLSEDRLCPGMVVTVEPGIYRPNWGGIRIEEDCLVNDKGCVVLSQPQTQILQL